MYPRIVINLQKLNYNIIQLKEMTKNASIPYLSLVTKAFAGDPILFEQVMNHSLFSLADSRIQNFEKFKHFRTQKLLLRSPTDDEIESTIKYTTSALVTNIETIRLLDKKANEFNKIYDIILMFDLGDLREGIFFLSPYLEIVQEIIKLKNIHLLGIGTNLTCYGGVLPSKDNLTELVNIATKIEESFQIKLSIISGGNSSIIPFLNEAIIPHQINHLRIGEAYIIGRETAYGHDILNMKKDVFTLETKIIEIEKKPSYPIGERGMNSFGEVEHIEDLGIQTRAIASIGKQDVNFETLTPMNPNIRIIGGSSDHLILDISDTSLKLFDIVSFKLNYPGVLHLMNSKYITKFYKK